MQRAMGELLDQGGAVAVELNHVVGGAAKGTAGMLNFARGLNPMDFYNLTHPAEYAQSVSTTLAGLVSTAAHPERIPGAFIDSFKDDPSEGLGRLIPELIGTKGLGGARVGARVGARIGKEALEAGTEGAAKHTPHPGSTPHEIPDWKDLAKPTDQVSERAIHADSVTPDEAQGFLDDQYPWLKDINNTNEYGYTDNCSHNVVTVDRRLDGVEVSTSPKIDPDHIPPKELGLKDREPGDYDWVHGYDDIIRDLESAGEGARSVVYIERADGTAHVFNAVNTDHGVVFLDGQSGTLAKLEDAAYIGHIPYKRQ
ncbi:toxin glutamine deamidase domain-containing protein [Streptomyces sp. NPDC056883]|uniref:toxin glutamine deamidase domain-containing protein n=1 Tax=Streptomyces sp. NPDC056883 TaxID=3345959 RepID=UPI0036BA085C